MVVLAIAKYLGNTTSYWYGECMQADVLMSNIFCPEVLKRMVAHVEILKKTYLCILTLKSSYNIHCAYFYI